MPDSTVDIATILKRAHTIAVVGLSADPRRPSNEVASYLQQHGFRIVPVNPSQAGQRILNELCHATLTDAATALKSSGVQIDVVDCFRRSDAIGPIADEAIAIGASCLWMQLGVINDAAAQKARDAGLAVVMDHCMKIEHMRTA
jgi:predicted CoA-binding protein